MAQSLLRRAGKAVMFNALGNWFGMVGGILSLVFIARLLSPMDFGIYGMTLVTFAIPEIFASGSLNESLIQRRNLQAGHVNSVFMQSLFLASVFWLGTYLLAPLIAQAFDHPELVPMIRVFAVSLYFGALTSVPAALLQRNLRYSGLHTPERLGIGFYGIVAPRDPLGRFRDVGQMDTIVQIELDRDAGTVPIQLAEYGYKGGLCDRNNDFSRAHRCSARFCGAWYVQHGG